MNKKEYEEKLECLIIQAEIFNKQIEELKNVKIEEDSVWKPKYNGDYWYIDIYCGVLKSIWKDTDADNLMLLCGNIFKTGEEAKFESERLKVVAELKKFSRKFRKGELNYYISLNSKTNELGIYVSDYYIGLDVYFESYKKANEAIEAVGEDRIKKYLFGIDY